tara:strand:- start:2201 stop:2947 length:747 start_codon:yes stop_codon:yes gene_type:complete
MDIIILLLGVSILLVIMYMFVGSGNKIVGRITKDNLVIVTTNMPETSIGRQRRQNLANNFKGFHIIFNKGIRTNIPIETMYRLQTNLLHRFKESGYEYGIICDDDFFPIQHFLQELNETILLLPKDWGCLHLCPGFLWGRLMRDKSMIGHLNPEGNTDISGLSYHTSGRFFTASNYLQSSPYPWMGGPQAFCIKRTYVDEFLRKFKHEYNVNPDASDVIFTRIVDNKTFVCREPQLGYEEECGGTTFL